MTAVALALSVLALAVSGLAKKVRRASLRSPLLTADQMRRQYERCPA